MAKQINAEDFDALITGSDVPVMLDLWAPWCGPCKALGPTIDAIAEEYEGKAQVCKLNIDEGANGEIAMRYGVASIPTLLFFKGGELKDRIVGLHPKDAITEKLSDLL